VRSKYDQFDFGNRHRGLCKRRWHFGGIDRPMAKEKPRDIARGYELKSDITVRYGSYVSAMRNIFDK
jgi:hypothetical protein